MIAQLTPAAAYKALEQDPQSVLLDVRTDPECLFVGVPSLVRYRQISFTLYPPTTPDPEFLTKAKAVLDNNQAIYCLCKTGGRSGAAAEVLAQAGFSKVTNIVHGFEGDHNAAGQRRSVSGWVADGLPWHQV